jgi:catechol 2,3-dioxygenase-like lactoylglutathione lyase family enzyme
MLRRKLARETRGEEMLDHVAIPVSDFEAGRKFYEKVLEPLGAKTVMEFPGVVLLGTEDGMVAIRQSDQVTPMHVAFRTDRAGVHAFYDAALAAGATDNGAPGVRSDYHPNYYAAFVRDPDGHNIEAVCHAPE